MRLFIDTANIEEIKTANALGVISGVTTNPSIIAREGKKYESAIDDITEIMTDGYIFAEVTALDAPTMVEEGKKLASLNDRMIIKIPMCEEGLKACKALSKEGIRVCITLMFSESQAILAANAGASFVAPFVGRVDDIGWDGLSLVSGIREIFDAQGIDVQIVAASTRHPVHINELAKCGCDIATVPFKIIMQMINHPLSKSGLEKFMQDLATLPKA
ncbi:MAG: fructose-6-phosphate aldolase [Ruminococcaceae bacterium]|nr:fructose-6-phosphate aldolase [Oscillospiraceae bacterium]